MTIKITFWKCLLFSILSTVVFGLLFVAFSLGHPWIVPGWVNFGLSGSFLSIIGLVLYAAFKY